ncbi:MAG: SgcJ/EcaC family oxidoreductase [Rhodothermales bacterium]|nr:SgcJ/EcaC family oxidoreductase [Rhodothermales bacterium]
MNRHSLTPIRSLLLVALLLVVGSARGQEIEIVRGAIDASNDAYMEAMSIPDARAVAELYAEDGYRLVGGGEVIRGRRAILGQMGEFFTRVGPIETVIDTEDVWVVDSLAYETGVWTYTFTPPGDARRTIGGRYVTIWSQHPDGEWRIRMDMVVPGTEY